VSIQISTRVVFPTFKQLIRHDYDCIFWSGMKEDWRNEPSNYFLVVFVITVLIFRISFGIFGPVGLHHFFIGIFISKKFADELVYCIHSKQLENSSSDRRNSIVKSWVDHMLLPTRHKIQSRLLRLQQINLPADRSDCNNLELLLSKQIALHEEVLAQFDKILSDSSVFMPLGFDISLPCPPSLISRVQTFNDLAKRLNKVLPPVIRSLPSET